MNASSRVAAFAALLAALFGIAMVAGKAIDPKGGDARAAENAGTAPAMDGMADAGGHAETDVKAGGASAPPPGLAVADPKLRLVADRTTLPAGRTEAYTFRIVDAHGATVRDFALEHGKRLHLIAVRRDLTGYQHLHPTQQADGSWTVPLRFTAPGAYRVFADFTPEDGEKTTLGTDVLVDGDAAYGALPAPAAHATVDGYDVAISGAPAAGKMTKLTFTVTRDGRAVNDLQPYLEARGHLVALRAGDLAYLHVHPEDEATPGDRISFMTELPTAGRYRLFLQFKHEDRIHTVAFTQEVQ
ncbi:MAG TPA: hypothetical protein VK501_27890 [Baekduia sp.]|uniref:hypothetical protein n=1 Tax=Baekduia sp. TaxID=2600305 RepID=UPI002B9B41DA|nr:hypothetical protein [Baekduia sp.]HMJ37761.1 hypothetical protein [Baekduia sp.]